MDKLLYDFRHEHGTRNYIVRVFADSHVKSMIVSRHFVELHEALKFVKDLRAAGIKELDEPTKTYVYICFDYVEGAAVGRVVAGVFKNREDALKLCKELCIDETLIEKHEVLEIKD